MNGGGMEDGAADHPAYRAFVARFGRLRRERRRDTLLFCAAFLLLVLAAAGWTEFTPGRVLAGLPRVGEYLGKLFHIAPHPGDAPVPVLAWGHLLGGVREPQSVAYWFYRIGTYLRLLWQTVQMAVLATALGFAAGAVLSFPAARNLAAHPILAWMVRRGLEFARSVPQVVLAFILVWPFGIGPLAGIVAIAIHTTGALGKLFAELNENADPRAPDALRAAGGTWLQVVRFGVLPQVLPGFLSYVLLRFEINVRSSTIIGFVGAGGIGQELQRVIGFNIYEEVSAILILILLLVVMIDLLSGQVRHRVIGDAGARA